MAFWRAERERERREAARREAELSEAAAAAVEQARAEIERATAEAAGLDLDHLRFARWLRRTGRLNERDGGTGARSTGAADVA